MDDVARNNDIIKWNSQDRDNLTRQVQVQVLFRPEKQGNQ
jgi:hypothetical protein